MNVERNLPVVRERKLAILKGDPELCAQQKKAGKNPVFKASSINLKEETDFWN